MTSERLNEWMNDKGLDTIELALILGMTRGGIIHWLKGRREIPLWFSRLVDLLDDYEIDIRELMEGEE